MLKRRPVILIMLISLLAVMVSVPLTSAAVEVDTSELREAVTVDGIREHQAALQAIADANGGTRVSGGDGYAASVDYVIDRLTAAGYSVTEQTFDFVYFEELSPAILEQTAPNQVSYGYAVDFFTMDYSGKGEVTADVEAVDLILPPTGGSTSGCEEEDFADFTAGNIALIQRGTCDFAVKAENAQAAGAAGVIIFNEGNSADRVELFGGTLGSFVASIPVVSASFALGEALNALIPGGLELHLVTDTFSEPRTSSNVLADTPGGRDDRIVLVGAHLDSVPAGPGINDNGSGTAVILETAEEISELGIEPRNKIRFAFWGAEEAGLVGSEYYVSQLSASQIKKIAVNLNFDMLGSPNYVRFVYDGDGSATATAGPNGSKNIEQVFLDYFAEEAGGLATEPTAFDGRSDYGPFIAVGIPAGGLFSGAEGIKTEEEQEIYGGTAGEQYDPCYHEVCDTVDNVSEAALDELGDAAAHAVLTFAETTSAVNGTDKGKGSGKWQNAMERKGPHLRK